MNIRRQIDTASDLEQPVLGTGDNQSIQFRLLIQSTAFLAAFVLGSTGTWAQERFTIEEVVVTAQKRTERIQDVPISITAFSSQDLQDLRIVRPRDLARFTPGLFMNASSIAETDPEFTLRGIGTNDKESNQNPATSLYVDGVPVPYNSMVGHTLFDLERVEVLKGPQGTLYGRNTTAGAVNFIPRKPTNELEGYVRADYGRFNRIDIEAAVNLPLTDTLAVRVAGSTRLQDGWQTLRLGGGPELGGPTTSNVDSRNGDQDRQSLRGTVRWTPTPAFELLSTVDAGFDSSESLAFQHAGNLRQDDRTQFCSFATVGIRDESQCASFARDPSTATLIPVELAGRQFEIRDPSNPGDIVIVSDSDDDPRSVFGSFFFGNKVDTDAFGWTTTLNWYADRFTLTSLTGYRSFERTVGGDNGSAFVVSDTLRQQDLEVVTQEVRIASNESWNNIDWVFGVFFNHEDVDDDVLFNFRDHVAFSAVFQSGFQQKTDSIAGFGQVDWRLSEKWTLIGGLRVTHEDRDFRFGGAIVGAGPVPVADFRHNVSNTEVTWRAGVSFHPVDNVLFYANVSKGFRGEGFPATIAFSIPQLLPFEKETLLAYEAGFKTSFDIGQLGWLQLNGSFYYYDWEDFQAQTAVDREGIRLIVLANAGDARTVGGEAEIHWMPTRDFSFRLGANFMKADVVSGNMEDNSVAGAPDIMLTGVGRYESSATVAGMKPFAQFSFSFTDDVHFILPNHPGATETSYWLFNARVGIKSPDDRWEVSFWAENIFDKTYRSEVFGPGSGFLPGRIHLGPPRMFGGTVAYSF